MATLLHDCLPPPEPQPYGHVSTSRGVCILLKKKGELVDIDALTKCIKFGLDLFLKKINVRLFLTLFLPPFTYPCWLLCLPLSSLL